MVYRIFFHFIYSNTVTCLATKLWRYLCTSLLIWQLWTCVLSISEVNFIVGYLTTAQLFVFLFFLYFVVLWRAAAEAFSGLSVGLAPCPMATSLSLTTGISAASAELPGLSALPKTRFPIAGSVRPVGQWIRDECLKMLNSVSSVFSVATREGFPV